MNDAYYQQKLFVAEVDKNDSVVGEVERWKAHKEGILHRGFTTILGYQEKYLLQHRKHIAFDKYWDFTFSSHQLYNNDKLQTDLDAIYQSLSREWNLDKYDLIKTPKKLGIVYYKAKDPDSIFTEHEFDYIYYSELKKLPQPNADFTYGYKLISSVDEIEKLGNSMVLAPWVTEIIKNISIPNLLTID